MKSSWISQVVIDGVLMDANTDNHQYQLYLKYMEKYGM
jgi:hypothetical protein